MNKHLLIPLVCLGFAASSAHAALIAHWKFDEGSGTTAFDSAESNDGTLSGSPTWVTGKIGEALDFGGGSATDVVQATVAGLPTGSSARTVSLWLNPEGVGTDYKFFSYGSTATGRAFSWTLEDVGGDPTVFFRFAGGNRQFTGATVALDEWTHVAMVVPDGATTVGHVLLYLNGALVTGTNSNTTLNTASSDVVIGGGGGVFSGDNGFNGSIDDVQMYDIALSSSEIQSLFNTPGSVIPEPSTALLGGLGLLALLRRRR